MRKSSGIAIYGQSRTQKLEPKQGVNKELGFHRGGADRGETVQISLMISMGACGASNGRWTSLAAGYVTVPSSGMALTNAEKQKRWRERQKALERATTDATERALLEQVERCVDLPDQERVALADRVGNEAMVLLWRAHWLGKIGEKVRTVPQDAVFEARRYLEARQPDAGRDRDSPQAR